MKLSNKIVLVTGGTSGIGLEAAKLFRQEGATVIIVGQNPDRLQSVAGQLGDSVTVLRGDCGRWASPIVTCTPPTTSERRKAGSLHASGSMSVTAASTESPGGRSAKEYFPSVLGRWTRTRRDVAPAE